MTCDDREAARAAVVAVPLQSVARPRGRPASTRATPVTAGVVVPRRAAAAVAWVQTAHTTGRRRRRAGPPGRTPGRAGHETRGEPLSKAEQILAALGGEANVVDLEPCITRLRVEVGDVQLVDETALKASGAFGVVRSGRIVQVIVGPEADNLAAELDALR